MDRKNLESLRDSLKELELVSYEIKKKEAEFKESLKSLTDKKSALIKQVDDLKLIIGKEALAEFNVTGEKKLTGGIGIRCSTTLEYDKAKAEAFCKEKNLFMVMDIKSFEKAADGLGLDFVKRVPVNSVTFPKEIKLEG